MTTVNKIYLDSAPVIYYLDDISPYKKFVQNIITEGINNDTQFFSSSLLNTEYLVMPYRMQNITKIADFAEFKILLQMAIISASDGITTLAAQLRAKYSGLKGMDAIHLATALYTKCDLLVTNDKQLAQVTEIPIMILDALIQ